MLCQHVMLADTIEDRREKVILKEPEGWMEQKQKRLANLRSKARRRSLSATQEEKEMEKSNNFSLYQCLHGHSSYILALNNTFSNLSTLSCYFI